MMSLNKAMTPSYQTQYGITYFGPYLLAHEKGNNIRSHAVMIYGLDVELVKCTKILEVNFFAFTYGLFHEDFSSILHLPTDCLFFDPSIEEKSS